MRKMIVIMILILMIGSLGGCKDSSQQAVSDGKNDIKGTIRISTFVSDRVLEEAAHKFETRHTGVKVEIDAYLTPEIIKQNNSIDLSDNYENIINTQLMSGKGADIIDVTGLPSKKYISRHMFVDINQLMESDHNYDASKYYSTIFAAAEINNGLYTLPIYYLYELLGSETRINADDKLWNWQEFFSAAQNALNGEDRYILADSEEILFFKIFRQSYSHFVDEEKQIASFNSQEFVNLLKQCKSLADKGLLAKSSQEISGKAEKQAFFQLYVIESVYQLASKQTNLYRLPLYDKGHVDGVFNMYAINNASPNKTAAWEFLKLLISDEIQTSPEIALPVNKSAFKERCATETEQFYQNESIRLSQDEKIELMQKAAAFNESIVNDIKYHHIDPNIRDIVNEHVQPFFTGKASAEDTAQVIQNKVNFYLKE